MKRNLVVICWCICFILDVSRIAFSASGTPVTESLDGGSFTMRSMLIDSEGTATGHTLALCGHAYLQVGLHLGAPRAPFLIGYTRRTPAMEGCKPLRKGIGEGGLSHLLALLALKSLRLLLLCPKELAGRQGGRGRTRPGRGRRS